MKTRIVCLSTAIICFSLTNIKADPVDSLVNVVTWEEAAGGNGHTYAILKMTITWDSARVIVPDLTYFGQQAYLATLTSQSENDFIMNNNVAGLEPQPVLAQQFFLGGEDQGGEWVWLNGEPMVYTNWSPGEPNNVGIETALSIWGPEDTHGNPPGQWNNTLPNLEVNPYIRQWSVVEWDQPDTMKSLILPNPIYAAMQHPIDEFFAQIYIGDFPEFYTAMDVDDAGILVNGSHSPASTEIVSHAFFIGDALKINVPIQNFVADYAPLWDVAEQEFTVEGEFTDATTFSITGTFTSIGHRLGDVNLDGSVNNGDLLFMVNRIFRNGPPPRFPELADVNGSCGAMNIHDLLYMINYIFRSGPAPVHCPET